ncbi:hypothetical protein F4780DRAFT_783374 [Xylariomycetidae sp. FL0641]|nr:hypothetical protein F4780DRAFT_783374 [Xylariomycetidae sp. FL0641]
MPALRALFAVCYPSPSAPWPRGNLAAAAPADSEAVPAARVVSVVLLAVLEVLLLLLVVPRVALEVAPLEGSGVLLLVVVVVVALPGVLLPAASEEDRETGEVSVVPQPVLQLALEALVALLAAPQAASGVLVSQVVQVVLEALPVGFQVASQPASEARVLLEIPGFRLAVRLAACLVVLLSGSLVVRLGVLLAVLRVGFLVVFPAVQAVFFRAVYLVDLTDPLVAFLLVLVDPVDLLALLPEGQVVSGAQVALQDPAVLPVVVLVVLNSDFYDYNDGHSYGISSRLHGDSDRYGHCHFDENRAREDVDIDIVTQTESQINSVTAIYTSLVTNTFTKSGETITSIITYQITKTEQDILTKTEEDIVTRTEEDIFTKTVENFLTTTDQVTNTEEDIFTMTERVTDTEENTVTATERLTNMEENTFTTTVTTTEEEAAETVSNCHDLSSGKP